MLRQICSFAAFAGLSLTAACQTGATSDTADAWITGRIINTAGKGIQAQLLIDGQSFQTDANGRFEIAPREELVYRIEVDADGHYAMRQTFSHAELQRSSALADIVLVEQAPDRTMLVFGGDLMIGRRFYSPFEGEPVLVRAETRLEDSKRLLREMKPYLNRADYASINLETPIFDEPPGRAAPKSVTFYSAPETLSALEWAGVDYVALGNNHTYDFLEPGLELTMAHLRVSALDHSGAGSDEAEAIKPHSARLAGSDYDFLSFVGWPAGPPTQSAEIDKGGAALGSTFNLISTSSESADTGAAPVVQFHGGLEYVEEPTLAIETKLKQSVDAGAALVIAHHPHVTQGLELYQDKLIAWSLGNFLFDQYFYSAQSAALLYVWMDAGEFYHAEAVPLYIKGYHPTPAVGAMRNKINRRLYELSDRRNTRLQRSGGHMILSSKVTTDQDAPQFDYASDCQGSQLRTGKDLLARGAFDAYALFDAPDRSWLDMDPRVTIEAQPDAVWDQAMTLTIDAGTTTQSGMRKFQRVFTKAAPMSLRAEIKSTADARIDAYVQIRAEGQGLSDALENGRKISLGSLDVSAGEATRLDLDFDSPRTRARSLRILLDVTAGDQNAEVMIDNLEWIEWETPFKAAGASCE